MGRSKSLRCRVAFLPPLALTAHEPEDSKNREQSDCKEQERHRVSHVQPPNGPKLTGVGPHASL